MKKRAYIFILFIGILLIPQLSFSQVDFNKTPDDDLGNVKDEYQEYFFEALKQKGIENYERAIDALNKCLTIDESKPVIYFELGKNYNHLKNFKSAEDALKKAISMQPDNEWFLDELYDVYYKQDDIESAISTLKRLVKYHPDYKQDLATLYIKQEKFDDALQLLDELDNALGVEEVREEMRNNIYSLSGNISGQVDKLKAEIFANPQNENAHLQLIYLYGKSGQAKQASEAAKTLQKLKPDSKFVHLALYKFYLQENNLEEAISSMKLVLNASEIEEREKSKVLKDFVAFVEKNPEYQKELIEATDNFNTEKDAESLSNLGTYYLKIGDKEKALQNYKEALNQNPNDFKLLRDVILLQIELKQYKEALQKSEEALELYPAQPILYLLNGVSNINLSNAQKAIDSLEMGLDFLIENPKMERDFYLQLSEAYKRTNNNKKSSAFAKKAQAIKAQ
ncbi:tetratricopeptide repeat protein [Winogradskyella sp.]|uniref:tetratricopeptide repeat protein n=1 Tax=Winogradskyella sp. TaxID=1883156 RepID=UPI0025FBEE03|nr:tetratricopeptide repeat protein [Winogradskyella sp.]MBT8243910.1 tetratricopeptide repeat protein [Winogradskyella sp.]